MEPLPSLLHDLYIDNRAPAKKFREHIRHYNKAFAFTSTGGSFCLDGSVFDGRGPPCYKIQGDLYHRLGPLCPEDGHVPTYSQLYIWDNAEALGYRQHKNPNTHPETMEAIQNMLMTCNPFIHVYLQAREIVMHTDLPSYSLRLDFLRASDRNRYNAPRSHTELAAIIPGDVETCINARHIIVCPKGGPLWRMTECHLAYIALHFPLLAPTGQLGWDPDMRHSRQSNGCPSANQRTCLTLCEYLCFRLHIRAPSVESDHYFRSSFLFQEYIVEMWLAAEHS